MFVDYYELLEIDSSASTVEIKSAFKKQALKWHPDKNTGIDTTEMMQRINEAYLILKDEEARRLYNIEYKRFKQFKKEREEHSNYQKESDSKQKNQQQSNNASSDNTYQKTNEKRHQYDSYEVFDETLKRWMENARNQAVSLAKQTIEDLRGMSIESGKAMGNAILSGIVRYVLFGILMLIIFKACNG